MCVRIKIQYIILFIFRFISVDLHLSAFAHDRIRALFEDLQTMTSLATSIHLQIIGLALGMLGWILCIISMGQAHWRVWHTSNATIISSGIAWVGIWKVCFNSHGKVSRDLGIMFCHRFRFNDAFIPQEISVAQVLVLAAIVLGTLGKAFTVFALRNIYMEILLKTQTISFFLILKIFAGVCVLIPEIWNCYSVAYNCAIPFPPSFYMPSSSEAQEVGAAIPVGIVSVILLLMSGISSLSYKHPVMPDVTVLSDNRLELHERKLEHSYKINIVAQ
ncbi:Claudin-34 [Platysternon megacephalum]|uniref:Claudin-34 n=1 Tax=Platysternon megacephalum TaxID=55544 RepID=A0A4D9EG44_9SAUR|nr:Claudin-34 [Platysternon megacephalum]